MSTQRSRGTQRKTNRTSSLIEAMTSKFSTLHSAFDRRALFSVVGQGFAGVALASLLGKDGLFAADSVAEKFPLARDAALKAFHHPPKAKRVVQLFMAGAASH